MGRPILVVVASATIVAAAVWLYRTWSEPAAPAIDADDARLESPVDAADEWSDRGSPIAAANDDTGGRQIRAKTQAAPGDRQVAGSAIVVEGDFPRFLEEAVDTWKNSPRVRGCRMAPALLREMAAERRDPFWSDRAEQELRVIAMEILPDLGQISVGCRSTICQISALTRRADFSPGDHWVRLERAILGTPLGEEFSSFRFMGGETLGRPDHITSVLVLTSAGHSSDEPENCFPNSPAPE